MHKLLLFASLVTLAVGTEVFYSPAAYYAPVPAAAPVVPAVYARHAAVVPLAYTRVHAAVPAVESYNSVQTPDSFQQQYRSDYKPVTYEYYR